MDEVLQDMIANVVADLIIARQKGITPLCHKCKEAFLGEEPEIVLIAALSHYGLLPESLDVVVVETTELPGASQFPPFPSDKSHLN